MKLSFFSFLALGLEGVLEPASEPHGPHSVDVLVVRDAGLALVEPVVELMLELNIAEWVIIMSFYSFISKYGLFSMFLI